MGYDNSIVDWEDRRKYPSGEATRIYKPSKGAKQMAQVTYRGCKYNTEDAKKEYVSWYEKTHSPLHPQNVYRGVSYRPCDNQEVAK